MLKNYLPFLALCLGSASMLWGQAVDMTYNSPGTYTYTVPATYKATIRVRAWGGGGGGGTGDGNNAKGGGGGGAFATNTYVDVPAGSYTIVVGAGGAPGENGGSSSFAFTGGLVTAGGGVQGGNTGGAGGVYSGTVHTDSKNGSAGGSRNDPNGAGGGGGAAGDANDVPTPGETAPDNLTGGKGGSPNGGDGGRQGQSGEDGNNRGGGGGGRGNNGASSGDGGNGRVVVVVISSVLPVELSALEAELKDQTVTIKWSTSTELNNAKFIIETSPLGETFQPLGEVAGAGTTTEPQNYSFTHHTPSAGINYYRLKQVDFDGTFEYSKVIAIEAAGSQDILAFPNPAQDKVTLQYDQSKGAGNIQLLDALGRRIQARITGYAGNYELSLPESLARGTYWLKVERGGKVQTLPVVKE